MRKIPCLLALFLMPLMFGMSQDVHFGVTFSEALTRLEISDPDLSRSLFETAPHYLSFMSNRDYSTGWVRFRKEALEFLKITAATTGAAILYGIVNDLFTAHICLEYFSEDFHKSSLDSMFPSLSAELYRLQSPILYAFVWGTIATWWVGLPLGLPVGLAARAGRDSIPVTWKDILPKMGIALGGTLVGSLLSGAYYYLNDPRPDSVEKRFDTDSAIHGTAYTLGVIMGIAASAWIMIERDMQAKQVKRERKLVLQTVTESLRTEPISPEKKVLIDSVLY